MMYPDPIESDKEPWSLRKTASGLVRAFWHIGWVVLGLLFIFWVLASTLALMLHWL